MGFDTIEINLVYKIFQHVNFKDISADVILEHSFKHDQ